MAHAAFPQVSRRAGVPLREQVRSALVARIDGGLLQPGDRLPTEVELAQQFNVSLAPVRSALADLADAGLITRQAGVGTFVTTRPVAISIDLLPSFTQTLRSAGVPFSTSLVERGVQPAPPELRATSTGADPAEAVHLRRVATIGGHRSVILDSWLPIPRFISLLEDPRLIEPQRSLYGYLKSEFGIRLTPGRGRLTVTTCNDSLLPLLDVPFGAPIVELETSAADSDGQIVEVTKVHYDASRFVFNINHDDAGLSN